MKFIVEKEFFDSVPNAYFGVIIVKNFAAAFFVFIAWTIRKSLPFGSIRK